MPKRKNQSPVLVALSDESQPIEHRREIFRMMAHDDSPPTQSAIDDVLGKLSAANGKAVYEEKKQKVSELLSAMMEGPLRSGTFIRNLPVNGTEAPYAQVLLDDGTTAYSVVPVEPLRESLRIGDRVLLEKSGGVLLRRGPDEPRIGEEGTLERCLDHGRVEISLRTDEKAVFLATQPVLDQIESGEVGPGATLIVNPRLSLALEVLPPADNLSHLKYLSNRPVPDVVVERDMGDPPKSIADIEAYLRLEMTNPGLRRRYRLNRSRTYLFAGIPGSGKSMSINAIIRQTYELISEVTGVPIDDLPRRVFTLKLSEILNSLLGESDKNLDRFFDEIEQLAGTPWVAPDGTEYELPCIGVLEEIDGIAAQRGQDNMGVYDRILTNALQKLDLSRPELRERLIVFIGTTNELANVDVAFLRRIGGVVENFSRLRRRAFTAILEKRLAELPVALNGGGHSAEEVTESIRGQLTDWLYAPNGSDQGVVELGYVGAASVETRFRRDVLTAALIDRAVEEACDRAAQAEERGEQAGLNADLLAACFDSQIRSVVGQLTEHNAHRYIDIPEGARVATVRRLTQGAATPFQLQRH